MESYSLMADSGVTRYESGTFEAGGYSWKLVFYSLGKNETSGANHISLDLRIANSDLLPLGWEINVCFKLFVQDQIRGKYLSIQGEAKRFYAMNTEWGFPEFLSMDTLKYASKGYLVNDSCVFGAEVFVAQSTGKWECFSVVKNPPHGTKYFESKPLDVGGRQWKLTMYPKGLKSCVNGQMLSMFLDLVDCKKLPTNGRVLANFKLRIRNQLCSNHYERNGKVWFDASNSSWGWSGFISLEDLSDASSGCILKDTLIAEVIFEAVSITTVK